MYPIKQNGIQEKFLKIGIMAAAIAAVTVAFGVGIAGNTQVAHADWGSIHGEFNNPNCIHHCSTGGGHNSGGDSGDDN